MLAVSDAQMFENVAAWVAGQELSTSDLRVKAAFADLRGDHDKADLYYEAWCIRCVDWPNQGEEEDVG